MSKGTRRERQAAELWKDAGMAVYRPATVRFGENDMFGLFDLLAVSPSHTSVHAIQVKSNHAAGIRDWCRHTGLFRHIGWRTMYAVPVDHNGWRLIECTEPDETVTVVDEREQDCDFGDGVIDWIRGQSGQ